MKKIISWLLAVTLVVSLITISGKPVQAKKFSLTVKRWHGNECIEFKWPKKKKATKYKIYMAKVTNVKKKISKKKFKKIITISSSKDKNYYDSVDKQYVYTDFWPDDLKPAMYYVYYIKAIDKKGHTILSTYKKKKNTYFYEKLMTPGVSATYRQDSNNENYSLQVSVDVGRQLYRGASVEIYKKKQGENSFKKVFTGKNLDGSYSDKDILLGNSYVYKTRTFIKHGKKTYYSQFSKEKTVTATNPKPEYIIKSITPTGVYKNVDYLDIVFGITNNSDNNAETTIWQAPDSHKRTKYVTVKSNDVAYGQEHLYNCCFKQYSYDNENWFDIPEDGIILDKTKTMYISARLFQVTGTSDSNERTFYYMGDDKDNYCSYICGSTIRYSGLYYDNFNGSLDLIRGTNLDE